MNILDCFTKSVLDAKNSFNYMVQTWSKASVEDKEYILNEFEDIRCQKTLHMYIISDKMSKINI